MNIMQGFLNVYKPSNISSAKLVSQVKKIFKGCKIGHMGTLDPMASGVLPIAVNKATKMFDYFLQKNKQYKAVFTFGYETDTLDALGKIVFQNDFVPNINEIKKALKNFEGEISQIPPNYSAKNVNGKRAYDLARQGKTFELNAKKVNVIKFQLTKQINSNAFEFLIECGSGTYIRSLCRDLAHKLNAFATMTFLERQKCGVFEAEHSVKIEELNEENLISKLIPIESAFPQYDVINVNAENTKKLLNGLNVKLNNCGSNDYIFVKSQNELIGLAKRDGDYLKLSVHLKEN